MVCSADSQAPAADQAPDGHIRLLAYLRVLTPASESTKPVLADDETIGNYQRVWRGARSLHFTEGGRVGDKSGPVDRCGLAGGVSRRFRPSGSSGGTYGGTHGVKPRRHRGR